MAEIQELAESLGRALGQTPEYRTLKRAAEAADEDRELVALKNEAAQLGAALESAIHRNEEPAEDDMAKYESVAQRLQALSAYQSLVAAQANFDRVMTRVDQSIQEGMRKGAASTIILAS